MSVLMAKCTLIQTTMVSVLLARTILMPLLTAGGKWPRQYCAAIMFIWGSIVSQMCNNFMTNCTALLMKPLYNTHQLIVTANIYLRIYFTCKTMIKESITRYFYPPYCDIQLRTQETDMLVTSHSSSTG